MSTRPGLGSPSRTSLLRLAVATLIATSAACATHQPPPRAPDESAMPGDAWRAITHDELSDARVVGGTVLDAITILRPMFLLSRTPSQSIDASINAGRPRPVRDLSGVPASEVTEIRYLAVGESQNRFGVRSRPGPVILVSLRTSPAHDTSSHQ